MTLANGQIVCRRYRVREKLSGGGYGAVYRARDLRDNQECAPKENLDTSAAAQSQFQQEAEMLGRLQHPNLPRVTDHFYEPDQGQYLVMAFVEGHALREVSREPAAHWHGAGRVDLGRLHLRRCAVAGAAEKRPSVGRAGRRTGVGGLSGTRRLV